MRPDSLKSISFTMLFMNFVNFEVSFLYFDQPSGNGDREAIVVGAVFYDGESERARAYTIYDTT